MNTPTLSRSECNVLRGLAIIGIFLHNYCHWIGSIVKENEYQYFQHNVDWLNQVLVNPGPQSAVPSHLILRTLWRTSIPLPERIRTGTEI